MCTCDPRILKAGHKISENHEFAASQSYGGKFQLTSIHTHIARCYIRNEQWKGFNSNHHHTYLGISFPYNYNTLYTENMKTLNRSEDTLPSGMKGSRLIGWCQSQLYGSWTEYLEGFFYHHHPHSAYNPGIYLYVLIKKQLNIFTWKINIFKSCVCKSQNSKEL